MKSSLFHPRSYSINFLAAFAVFCIFLIDAPLPHGSAAVQLQPISASAAMNSQVQKLVSLGQLGGEVQDVAIQANLAYAGFGPRLLVFDVSRPELPVLLGQSSPLPGVIEELEVSGNYAYLKYCDETANGFVILDVRDPNKINTIGRLPLIGCSKVNFVVSGGYVYLPSNDSLSVIDAKDPANPKLANSIQVTKGTITDIAIVGTRVYLPTTSSELILLDVSNPASPTLSVSMPAPWDNRVDAKLSVIQHFLYVSAWKDLHIYDIQDLDKPVRVSSTSLFNYAKDIVASADFVAVSEDYDKQGLAIVDVKDKIHPVIRGYLDMKFGGNKLEAAGSQVYIADDVSGLKIVDVQALNSPYEIGGYVTVPILWNLAVKDSFAYAGDQYGALSVLNIQGSNPRQVGLYQPALPTNEGIITCPDGTWLFGDVTLYDLAISGDYVYAASGLNGLQIFSVADPSNPKLVGNLDTPGDSFGVAISGNKVYLADLCYGLRIIDVQDPAHPAELGRYAGIHAARGVTLASHYAYVTDYFSNFFVLDVQDPASPVKVFELPSAGAWDVLADGQYLYLPTLEKFRIYDLSNPASPALLGEINKGSFYVAVEGQTAYLTDQGSVAVYDLRDPAHPALIDQRATPGLARGLAVLNGIIYIADDRGGLYEMKLTDKLYFMPLVFQNYRTK